MWAAILPLLAKLLPVFKWLFVTFAVPAFEKWVAAKQKAIEASRALKAKFKKNQEKTEAYEKDPSDSNFSELP